VLNDLFGARAKRYIHSGAELEKKAYLEKMGARVEGVYEKGFEGA
jgi:hypothetical protein